MSGTGLDFPISTKYICDDEATIEKNAFSSSTSLNRHNSIESEWTTTTDLYRSNTFESFHGDTLKVDITQLQPLKTKPSSNTIGSGRSAPATPGSILTFASTATTLVDYHHNSKLPVKLPHSYSDSDNPMFR